MDGLSQYVVVVAIAVCNRRLPRYKGHHNALPIDIEFFLHSHEEMMYCCMRLRDGRDLTIDDSGTTVEDT
jgi:hypothetical protein